MRTEWLCHPFFIKVVYNLDKETYHHERAAPCVGSRHSGPTYLCRGLAESTRPDALPFLAQPNPKEMRV